MKELKKTYKEPVIEMPVDNGTGVENIVGNFTQSSTAPISPPKTFKDSVVIVGNKLYFFDYKNSTWQSTGTKTSYSGHMSGAGVFTLPTGWTGYLLSAGAPIITHNLGTQNFDVLATSYDSNNFHFYLAGLSTNDFELNTFTVSADVYTQATIGFSFILQLQ